MNSTISRSHSNKSNTKSKSKKSKGKKPKNNDARTRLQKNAKKITYLKRVPKFMQQARKTRQKMKNFERFRDAVDSQLCNSSLKSRKGSLRFELEDSKSPAERIDTLSKYSKAS